ncbi:complement factor H isoform X3 [Microcaecilia unicolor]|uniref:Complement factor H isoform X3 n=1 Tax=Microcaecilia unicolor TaxID=1415580 RepID=A0A6P7YFX0_9AMPH|nr:complement factor H isoform X3 [Microcaecilia unicolor]
MALLEYIILLMLWGSCSAEAECGPPDSIPIAELVGEWDKESYPHGTEATYLCRPGYIKVGRILWKCLNGEWKEVNPMVKCRNKPCGHPGDLLYGSFDLTRGTDFVFGSRVEYQCDDGYQMISRVNYRECTATGWNNYVPQCEVRKCLPVQPPQNGRIVMTSISDVDEEYPYGYILLFECDSPNYKLSGPNELYCMKSGEWSADVPACEVISCQEPSIPNGKMMSRLPRKMQYENKERIQYECDPGYKHESRGYSECIENGWNPAPSCIEIVCSFQNVVNGNLQPEKNVYRENERVNLICNKGYQPEYKDEFPKCTKTGWSSPLLCVHKDCSFPEIENGRLLQTQYSTYKNYYFPMRKGRKIDYICTEGFFTEEGNSWGGIECTDEGWSPVPKCIKEMCESFRVVNGYPESSAARYQVGDKGRYSCYQGYSTPEGMSSGEIECLKNGWSVQPTCIKICTKPVLHHGHYSDKPVFMAGDILQYECDEGYMTSDRNIIERLKCTESGWTKTPECIAITCSVDDEIPNGVSTPQKEEYENGHVLKFSCNENYKIKGEELRQCYYFGWFPKTLPQCIEITCKRPSRKGALLSPHLQIYKHLDTVNISCEDGYKINGSDLIQCYSFGWYPKPPTCQVKKPSKLPTDSANRTNTNDTSLSGLVKKCPPAPQLENAETVPSKDYYNGDTVKYICNENCQLQGKEEIECKNEKWTSPPRCIKSTEKCPYPPELHNTVEQNLKDHFNENDTVHFKCHETFILHGSESIQCRKGSWTSPPQCIETQVCKQPPTINNGKAATPLKPSYSDGDIVIYNCDSGYQAEESNEITCTGGKWSTPPQCKETQVCKQPPTINNGKAATPLKPSYSDGDTVIYNCDSGYQAEESNEITCTGGKWSTPPQCKEALATCDKPPFISNGAIQGSELRKYKAGQSVTYRCINYYVMDGSPTVTCLQGRWSQPPTCFEALATCDQPPSISNGAIQGSELRKYKAGQSVTYRCINYYVMDGSPTVTCLQGRWSQPPTCFEPCTASDEEMKTNNIQLRWLDDEKLYVQHGHRVEFTCKYNYVVLPPSQEFRLTCIRGHLDYPKCIKHGSCMVSLVELVKNNLELGKEYTEVLHGSFITFKCKTGFSPVPRQNMKMKCHDTRLTYPKCTSSTPSKSCGPPLAIENGGISGTSISDYVHGSSVEYRCARYYKLKDPKPVVCNDGEWSNPPECVEPCTLNEDQIFKNNIVLSRQHRNEMFYTHMGFVEFECKYGYRFQGTSPLRAQCVNQTLVYPKCS